MIKFIHVTEVSKFGFYPLLKEYQILGFSDPLDDDALGFSYQIAFNDTWGDKISSCPGFEERLQSRLETTFPEWEFIQKIEISKRLSLIYIGVVNANNIQFAVKEHGGNQNSSPFSTLLFSAIEEILFSS